MNKRSDLFAVRGNQRDGPIRALRELERLAGGVDVAPVVEAIRNVERRVAKHPSESLAQAGRPSGPQLDDEVGRLVPTQPRPDDPCDDAQRNEQRDSPPNRLQRGSCRAGRAHPSQPEQRRGQGEPGGSE